MTSRMGLFFGTAALAVGACGLAEAEQATWGPWESLGGNLAPTSIPECRRQGETIDCWSLRPGGSQSPGSNLVWLRGDGETWAGWVNLGGTLRAAPECVSRGDEIDCFAASVLAQGVSPLDWIHYDGDAWGDWQKLGGSVRQKPACLAGPGQDITCVALADDGTGFFYYLFDGTAWQPATKIAFPVGVTSQRRAMCTDTARGTYCFTVDTSAVGNDTLWTILRDKDGTWGQWQPLTTGVDETPHCLASGARLDCFSRSTSDRLIAASFNGSTWSQWLTVGSEPVLSQPYCNKLASGFDCYWTGTGNELRRQRRDHAVWLPVEDLGGAVKGRPECPATPGGQRIDCFVQGVDNNLQHRAFD